MKKSVIFSLATGSVALFLFACGQNNPAPSPANGHPVSYLYQHPDQVQTVICPDGTQGVIVCHYPPGNPLNAQTICVGPAAVPAHVNHHGDTLGVCGSQPPPPGGSPVPSPFPSASPISSPNVG